jgi:uncharacterized protein
LAVTFLACVAALLLAVVMPQNPNARVHDFAGLLSADQRTALEQIAQDVEKQTTAQLAIVTVQSLDGKTVEHYANELFNAWGIGRKDLNNGVLLLVAPQQRRMRIEVGRGVELLLTDALCGQIRDTFIIPRFKQGDFAGGIVAGTAELVRVLKSDPEAARGSPNSGPALARAAQRNALAASGVVVVAAVTLIVLGFMFAVRRLYSTTAFISMTAGGLIVLAIAAWLTFRAPKVQLPLALFGGAAAASLGAWGFNLAKYRRFGPHGCSKCGTHLELLSEQEDDPKLSSVQRLEEQIGSVDYDVWICRACLNGDTERYVKRFSGFQDCAACKARTFKSDPQEVLVPATRTSTGRARIEGRCISCNHKTVQNIVLPKLPQPSSSSGRSSGGRSFGGGGGGSGGGGFGGGSSRGGGASGGW